MLRVQPIRKYVTHCALYIILALQACAPTVADVSMLNSVKLNRLSVGMPKPSAMEVMGPELLTVRKSGLITTKIGNPIRSEAVQSKDGGLLEVLYYSTAVTRSGEFVFTDDELTPLVFRDGRLMGWGWNLLFQHIDRAQLHFRYDANPPKTEP